jgi:gingipain R
VDPQKVPFSFGDNYESNQFYPQEIVSLSDPYLLREVRGVSVTVSPIAYNPVTKILRVYDKLRVEVRFDGRDGRNSPERSAVTFNEHFINLHVG